jgi:hypothetical protein
MLRQNAERERAKEFYGLTLNRKPVSFTWGNFNHGLIELLMMKIKSRRLMNDQNIGNITLEET